MRRFDNLISDRTDHTAEYLYAGLIYAQRSKKYIRREVGSGPGALYFQGPKEPLLPHLLCCCLRVGVQKTGNVRKEGKGREAK